MAAHSAMIQSACCAAPLSSSRCRSSEALALYQVSDVVQESGERGGDPGLTCGRIRKGLEVVCHAPQPPSRCSIRLRGHGLGAAAQEGGHGIYSAGPRLPGRGVGNATMLIVLAMVDATLPPSKMKSLS